jgi:UDP-glucose:(heptosyl)LPS alpha-1,3-glucosyltransferase
MRVALGIVRLFPEGGLQRHCLDVARLLLDRGHQVTVFTSKNLCDLPDNLSLTLLPVRAFTNHGIDLDFAGKFAAATAGRFDRIVGFNKLSGLDFLYCADPPVDVPRRALRHRFLPRHRVRLKLEAESFRPASATHIIALTASLAEAYRQYWGLDAGRFTIIPPVIDSTRRRGDLRHPDRRKALRAALHIPQGRSVWLWIGAKPHIKGLDRVLAAMVGKPDAFLLIVGVTATRGEGRAAAATAQRLGIFDRVRFYGYCEDIPDFLAAADLLVHPARLDVTGQVLLESIINGLPVIASACCGFASLVRAANAGIVLPEPFQQSALEAAVRRLEDATLADLFSRNGMEYGRSVVPLDGMVVAADVIEHGPDLGVRSAQAPAPPAAAATAEAVSETASTAAP